VLTRLSSAGCAVGRRAEDMDVCARAIEGQDLRASSEQTAIQARSTQGSPEALTEDHAYLHLPTACPGGPVEHAQHSGARRSLGLRAAVFPVARLDSASRRTTRREPLDTGITGRQEATASACPKFRVKARRAPGRRGDVTFHFICRKRTLQVLLPANEDEMLQLLIADYHGNRALPPLMLLDPPNG